MDLRLTNYFQSARTNSLLMVVRPLYVSEGFDGRDHSVANCSSNLFVGACGHVTYCVDSFNVCPLTRIHKYVAPLIHFHSGFFGGSIRNPLNELCRLIAGMHDADGRVTLPGFYDKVRALSDDERADLAKLPQE